ncbi:MAG TPA: ion channel [Saprospiraceae bacterium]|nr:ion channel [Saprospiraceae bacterium]
MSLWRHNINRKTVENTGLNSVVSNKFGRFVNKDGTANIQFVNKTIFQRHSVYHYLINIPGWKFIFFIFAYYAIINFIFALIYYWFCLDHLAGLIQGSPLENFEEAYFFSSQTLTTVGYGRVSPVGLPTNTIASTEALIGILTLALVTGLLYGRFVKPRAYIRFTKQAVIAPFKEGRGLMFRLAPIKGATLSEVEVKITGSLMLEENGKRVNKYVDLPLQFNTLTTLYLTWTVVHPINEDSPIHGMTLEELDKAEFEMIVFVKAFDEDFSNTVIARTSYHVDEITNGAKFIPVYIDSAELQTTVVDMTKFDSFNPTPEAAL